MKNAQEFLLKFAETQDSWFKSLIYLAINYNGKIPKDLTEKVLKSYLSNTEIQINRPTKFTTTKINHIKLKELTHHKGVNALATDQTILFSDNITILYGLNGVGKSGYFRILNEIIGGNEKKDILSNIYSEKKDAIKVNIKYENDSGIKNNIEWYGEKRGISPFTNCSVFDSSYLNSFLETRTVDNNLLVPFGLHLFKDITDILESYKIEINNKITTLNQNKPIIDFSKFTDDIKELFINSKLDKEKIKKIKKAFNFSEKDKSTLIDLYDQKKKVTQTNYNDTIKLVILKIQELEKLTEKLKQNDKQLQTFIENKKSFLQNYSRNKTKNDIAKQNLKVLNDLPKTETQEWKDFISAGYKYSLLLENNEGLCPFCHQKLSEEKAISIIKAYTTYLNDTSEKDLQQDIKNLNHLKETIFLKDFNIDLQKIITKELEYKLSDGINLSTIINNILIEQDSLKKSLLNEIDSKKAIDTNKTYSLTPIISTLESIIQSNKTTLKQLNKNKYDKEKQILEITQSIKNLEGKKSISQQKTNISKWLEDTELEEKLNYQLNSINTRKLSILSKKAHEELITDSLVSKFNFELNKLGFKNLHVSIKNTSVRKTEYKTKLVLVKDNKVKSILSEGEQKAIALSLFLAEIDVQENNNPIILDDPVTSLDNKIASNFANRLMEVDNQIILFIHNSYFLTNFEASSQNHICKTTSSPCINPRGKHIKIYRVNSQGINNKGILSNYKTNKAKTHLRETQKLLQAKPFEENEKAASLLRLSIECIIDEMIFNHLTPTKFGTKTSKINWKELKGVNKKLSSGDIDTLQRIHSRVSGGELHNGFEKIENEITFEELESFTTKLTDISNK